MVLHPDTQPQDAQEGTELAALFYRADKLSRNCFSCPVQEKCDWPRQKRIWRLNYENRKQRI